jgi:PiT family inorganic phosphate transporter
MLISTAVAGIRVSTTHTITGIIVGVGAPTRLSAVRWGIAGRIIRARIPTIRRRWR